jgi:hypothetical protein
LHESWLLLTSGVSILPPMSLVVETLQQLVALLLIFLKMKNDKLSDKKTTIIAYLNELALSMNLLLLLLDVLIECVLVDFCR